MHIDSNLFRFATEGRLRIKLRRAKGRGVPNVEFSHYATVPRNVQDEIIAARK